MDLSRDWIGEYVDLPSDEELAAGLTEVGLAIEGQTPVGEDLLLDVDITTNRPDCMNHLGMAREVAVRFDRELRVPPIDYEESNEPVSDVVSVELADPEACPRFVARVVRGVKVGPSPTWLKQRLETIGQRPINNVVDITNYVMWESGQPVHGFDLAKIGGGRIIVRRAKPGETLVTLDGDERKLVPEILVVADEKAPVGIGGVMGGLDSEVTEETVDVLIECAHFEPGVVRKSAALLAMHTDANHRFERGADPEAPLWATQRVARLISEIAGGTVLSGAVDVTSEYLPKSLVGELSHERLESFAGACVPRERIEQILTRLGFKLTWDDAGSWNVVVPSWRYHDMKYVRPDGKVYEADLFEEVLRHVGFDNIPSALPPVESPDTGLGAGHAQRQRVRTYLSACGLAEAINYAFHAQARDGETGIWADGDLVRVANPLSELYNAMRRSLLVGLTDSALFNQHRGAESVRLFEVGHIFPGYDKDEVETIGVVLGGDQGSPWQRSTTWDLFDLKGIISGLGEHFGVPLEVRSANPAGVVPGTGATVHHVGTDRAIGWIGQLLAEDASYPLFGAEIEASALVEGERFSTVVAPSKHPGVTVDLTLTHSTSVSWREVESLITETGAENLIDFGLKDRYSGKGVAEGAVNTTIYFVYNADDRSLTQEEVNARQDALAEVLQQRFGLQDA